MIAGELSNFNCDVNIYLRYIYKNIWQYTNINIRSGDVAGDGMRALSSNNCYHCHDACDITFSWEMVGGFNQARNLSMVVIIYTN